MLTSVLTNSDCQPAPHRPRAISGVGTLSCPWRRASAAPPELSVPQPRAIPAPVPGPGRGAWRRRGRPRWVSGPRPACPGLGRPLGGVTALPGRSAGGGGRARRRRALRAGGGSPPPPPPPPPPRGSSGRSRAAKRAAGGGEGSAVGRLAAPGPAGSARAGSVRPAAGGGSGADKERRLGGRSAAAAPGPAPLPSGSAGGPRRGKHDQAGAGRGPQTWGRWAELGARRGSPAGVRPGRGWESGSSPRPYRYSRPRRGLGAPDRGLPGISWLGTFLPAFPSPTPTIGGRHRGGDASQGRGRGSGQGARRRGPGTGDPRVRRLRLACGRAAGTELGASVGPCGGQGRQGACAGEE
ncbi:hypothetical protein H8959_013597 [Pygathrix nigripes]